ncbi:MAG: hypothetical protein Q4D90_10400 [bacterium]|nr:hypothetical protein [bacterium]
MGYEYPMFERYADGGEPKREPADTNLEKLCVDFIREDCQRLNYSNETEKRGKSGIPYNYEQDVNRLCFERAIHRFLQSGTKETAFDIYYCYSDLFSPFGRGYQATRTLLETLSDHESNGSSLLMSHRDHYSHSVYVFLLGIAVYKGSAEMRHAYNKHFGFEEESAESCNHFLKNWGLTALFHDIGYPFEIAHQQIKTLAYQLVGKQIGKKDRPWECPPPFVSYGKMEQFTKIIEAERYLDLNDIFASELSKRFGKKLGIGYEKFYDILEHRAVDSVLYMDHAYFSGLLMLKRLLAVRDEDGKYTSYDFHAKEPLKELDALIAILLHNSLYRFEFGVIGSFKSGDLSKRLSLKDEQPLCYLLMLCDELQCWDRATYGQNTRKQMSPFGADIFFENGGIQAVYWYDELYGERAKKSSAYQNMNPKADGSIKFRDDIAEFLNLDDVGGLTVSTVLKKKDRILKKYASNSNYLNLYDFALALNGRYSSKLSADTIENLSDTQLIELQTELEREFDKLPLEYKLSNLAQARTYEVHLEKINCFYSSVPMDYEIVTEFSEEELGVLAFWEHDRWEEEKLSMGWIFDDNYKNKEERELRRVHGDLIAFGDLTQEAKDKDAEPMRLLLKLLNLYDGLRMYRLAR